MKQLPVKPPVTLDDVGKIDVRVGTIESVVDVERSAKLVELTVHFGAFTRRALVWLKRERDHPHELCGRQASFIVNLLPREMAGRVSEAMLFGIGYANGIQPMLATRESPVPDGATAG